MNKIPSLDLRDFLSEDANRKEEFVQSIGRAFQEIGFCAVKGHLLSDDLVERLYKQIKLFFDDLDSAVNFAKKNNYSFEVMKTNHKILNLEYLKYFYALKITDLKNYYDNLFFFYV